MRQILITLLAIMVLSTVNCKQTPIRSITSYKNCFQQWHNIKMNGEKTICESGSLVTSLAMLIQSNGIPINNMAANPKWLNKYLKAFGGYPTDGRSIDFQLIGKLGLELIETVNSPSKMRNYFDKGFDVIINHNYGTNYVVLIGYDDDKNSEFSNIVNNPKDDSKREFKDSEITVAMIFKKKE